MLALITKKARQHFEHLSSRPQVDPVMMKNADGDNNANDADTHVGEKQLPHLTPPRRVLG